MTTPAKSTAPAAAIPTARAPSPVVALSARDLNAQGGIFCPSPKADMKVWNTHPKVYLEIARTGEAKCPYCGTVYRLRDGEKVGHGH
jgi:uncharacterized Zn-finger protein